MQIGVVNRANRCQTTIFGAAIALNSSAYARAQNTPPRHPRPIPDKLHPIHPPDSDPNIPKYRSPLPPLLRRPDDGLDKLNPRAFKTGRLEAFYLFRTTCVPLRFCQALAAVRSCLAAYVASGSSSPLARNSNVIEFSIENVVWMTAEHGKNAEKHENIGKIGYSR